MEYQINNRMYLKGNNNLWREGSLDLDSINVLSQSCFIFPLFPSWFSVLILAAKRRSVLFLFSYKRLRLESICLLACHRMNQKYRCVFFLSPLFESFKNRIYFHLCTCLSKVFHIDCWLFFWYIWKVKNLPGQPMGDSEWLIGALIHSSFKLLSCSWLVDWTCCSCPPLTDWTQSDEIATANTGGYISESTEENNVVSWWHATCLWK